jgi:hypothetical protein
MAGLAAASGWPRLYQAASLYTKYIFREYINKVKGGTLAGPDVCQATGAGIVPVDLIKR